MSRIDIQAIDGGCDRSSSIETMIDNVKYWPTSGTFLYPCTTTFIEFIDTTYINRFKVSGNTIYLNGSLYWPSSNVTIQIKNVGNGRVWTRGGANTLADRSSITVPAGTQVYFEARPAANETFLRFEGDGGVTTTQNPFNTTVNFSGTMTGNFSGETPTGSSSTVLLIGVAIAAGLAYYFSQKKKGESK